MSWIRSREIVPASAGHASVAPPGADLASLWQALALDPATMRAVQDQGRALRADSPLTPAQAEMIAVAVSATQGCGYCVAHDGARLAQALGDEPLARAVALDYRQANLAARDRVLLDFAVALTCEPSERKLEDVERLREYGFDDAAILRATHLTAHFGALSRMASGLGVELEPGVAAWEFGAQR